MMENMREMDLEMQQLVVTVTRVLRRQIERAAAKRGGTVSDAVRDALTAAYGETKLTKRDMAEIAEDIELARAKRLEIREDRRNGVKRPNGRPPGTQIPGGHGRAARPKASGR